MFTHKQNYRAYLYTQDILKPSCILTVIILYINTNLVSSHPREGDTGSCRRCLEYYILQILNTLIRDRTEGEALLVSGTARCGIGWEEEVLVDGRIININYMEQNIDHRFAKTGDINMSY